jgi:uncharacterized membrane protein YraQ (UPF0718 family)
MESAPYVVLGFLIAGIIHYWVPQKILHQHLGGDSPFTLFKAVGVGCILPLCSCGTIPLGIGLYRSGAAIGNMLAFMTSTPILSPVLIALSLKLLGATLTATLVTASVLGAFVIGFVGNVLFKKSNLKSSSDKSDKVYSSEKKQSINERNGKISKTLRWSFFELGADVSVDILIGLGIAALLLTLLPLEWISTWLGQQDMFTLLYVILLGIPVYACSIPSIAVVQGLLLLGATPGAAIAYMIAGPATNLGELNAIRKSMGLQSALYYAVALVVMALVAGTVTDQLVFPDYQYHAYRVQGELVVQQCCVPLIFGDRIGSFAPVGFPLWHWPFGILFFSIILYGLVSKLKHFIINPCKTCTWKEYGRDGTCGSKCHVRRKYEFLRGLKRHIFL